MKKIKNIIVRKPVTASQRKTSYIRNKEISKLKPVRSLTHGFQRSVGRDNMGHISVRHKGGGVKRKFRVISTLDQCGEGPFEVLRFEYDPNRSSNIMLIKNKAEKLFYVIAPLETKIGHKLECGDKAPVAPGNRMPIGRIPTGVNIHSVEFTPGSVAKLVKSAGTKATIMSHEKGRTLVKLPSGELRLFNSLSQASVGALGNENHSAIRIGKAGRKRHMGVRPTVRGLAMSPNAHPHGGGEGGSSIGMKAPKTPWGKRTLGVKTRRKHNYGGFIVKRRQKKR